MTEQPDLCCRKCGCAMTPVVRVQKLKRFKVETRQCQWCGHKSRHKVKV